MPDSGTVYIVVLVNVRNSQGLIESPPELRCCTAWLHVASPMFGTWKFNSQMPAARSLVSSFQRCAAARTIGSPRILLVLTSTDLIRVPVNSL